MADRSQALLRRLRGLALPPADDDAADAELLGRFVRGRDPEAFAALVRRHGGLVLGVCRRTLRDTHRAEDAFQAVWLVLARKAASIRQGKGLAAWLHAVARQVAGNARRGDARCHAREGLAQSASRPPANPLDELTAREFLLILDEEMQRLPEAHRLAVLCCCFEGLSLEEAARRLGWTPGSVKGRLERGRRRLHARLLMRGVTLSAALKLMEVSRSTAGLPEARAAETAWASLAGAAGEDGAVLAGALVLANGAAPGKYRITFALLLALGAAAVGAGTALQSSPAKQHPTGEKPATRHAEPAGSESAGRDVHGDPLPTGAVARLGTLRFNHGEGLNSLFFLTDAKTILSEGNGSLRLWDAATGKELAHHATAKPPFDDQTALTPDGKTLILLYQEKQGDTVHFWDLVNGKETRVVRLPVRRFEFHGHRRNALARDGRRCALHIDNHVRVFDTATGKELWRSPAGGDEVVAVTFAGKDRVVTADKKQVVSVWEAGSGKLLRQFAHGATALTLVASDDGRFLATLVHPTRDNVFYRPEGEAVRVWDLATGTLKHTHPALPKHGFSRTHFSPNGNVLFAHSHGDWEGILTGWDVATGRQIGETETSGVSILAVRPDGGLLAEGGGVTFRVREVKRGWRLTREGDRHVFANGAFLSPAGDRAFTFDYNSPLRAWDGRTGRYLHDLRADLPPLKVNHPLRSHSPDGRFALSLAGDYKAPHVLLWDVNARRVLHTLRIPGADWALASAFSADSSLLATQESRHGSDIRIWDVRTGLEVRSFKETKAGGRGRLFFAADGKTLFVADRRVVGYEVASGKELFVWQPQALPSKHGYTLSAAEFARGETTPFGWRALAVSPQGTVVACVLSAGVGTDPVKDRIALYEATTGKLLCRWGDSGNPDQPGEQLTFSPDGRLLASSDGDAVHLWEVATGKEIRTLRGHRGDVRAVAFSLNGRRLATVGADATVLLWDLVAPTSQR